jgi:hypothetical protein
MDRLNSWVRSKSFRGHLSSGTLRRRIYEMKSEALRLADREFRCVHRSFETLTTCRSCGGSGQYLDWNGHTWPHCRACMSKGVVRLDFVETRIFPDPARKPLVCLMGNLPKHLLDQFRGWRSEPLSDTPVLTWISPRFSFPFPQSKISGETTLPNWTVNLPGEDLTPNEVARDLLLCESVFPKGFAYRECRSWCECTGHYKLYVGKETERCAHCDIPFDLGDRTKSPVPPAVPFLHRCGKLIGRVEFTFSVCSRCYEDRKNSAALFDVVVPAKLVAPPFVAAWIEKNNALADPRREGAVR